MVNLLYIIYGVLVGVFVTNIYRDLKEQRK